MNIWSGLGQAIGEDYDDEWKRRKAYYSRGSSLKDKLLESVLSQGVGVVGETIGRGISSIIEAPYERDRAEFEEREDIRKAKRLFKEDEENAAFISNTNLEIKNSGLSEEEWWRKTTYDRASEFLKRDATGKGLDPEHFSEDIARQAQEFTDANWEGRKDSFSKARLEMADIGTSKNLQRKIDLANRRPRNILESGLGSLRSLFGGKTTEEIESESIENLKKSRLYQENEEFRNAFVLYQNSGNFQAIRDKKAKLTQDPNEVETVENIKIHNLGDGNLAVSTTYDRTEMNPVTKEKRTTSRMDLDTLRLSVNTDEEKDQALLDIAQKNLNLPDYAAKVLSTEGMIRFTKQLEKEDITLTSLKSMSEYNRTSDILQGHMSVNVNLKDPVRDQKNVELTKVVYTQREAFIAELAQLLDDVKAAKDNPVLLKTTTDALRTAIINDINLINNLNDLWNVPTFSR